MSARLVCRVINDGKRGLIIPFKKMKAFNQFIKEFWIPIVLGLTWAILSTYNNSESFTLSFIKNFGACFFLTSWLGGQILRIIKQQKLDKNFDNVFLKIDDITNRLERVTHDIRGYITGGESFCYLEVNRYEKGSIAALMHEGQFPLYQVGIALNDLKNPEKDPRKWTRIEVGDMSPGLVKTVEEADLKLKECDDN
ncbi:MAG TPA: hypothetical protein VJI69_05030, partial [Bacteroidia bacterium]|nr:hypothetical protein [Bacteroidia bacterium]